MGCALVPHIRCGEGEGVLAAGAHRPGKYAFCCYGFAVFSDGIGQHIPVGVREDLAQIDGEIAAGGYLGSCRRLSGNRCAVLFVGKVNGVVAGLRPRCNVLCLRGYFSNAGSVFQCHGSRSGNSALIGVSAKGIRQCDRCVVGCCRIQQNIQHMVTVRSLIMARAADPLVLRDNGAGDRNGTYPGIERFSGLIDTPGCNYGSGHIIDRQRHGIGGGDIAGLVRGKESQCLLAGSIRRITVIGIGADRCCAVHGNGICQAIAIIIFKQRHQIDIPYFVLIHRSTCGSISGQHRRRILGHIQGNRINRRCGVLAVCRLKHQRIRTCGSRYVTVTGIGADRSRTVHRNRVGKGVSLVIGKHLCQIQRPGQAMHSIRRQFAAIHQHRSGIFRNL